MEDKILARINDHLKADNRASMVDTVEFEKNSPDNSVDSLRRNAGVFTFR